MKAATVALAIGDPNGVGPEIAVKAAARLSREGGPNVVLVGDEFVIRFYGELCAKDLTLKAFDGAGCGPGVLRFLSVNSLPCESFSPGTPLAAGGQATVDYVSAAMSFVRAGNASAIVGCTHSESSA